VLLTSLNNDARAVLARAWVRIKSGNREPQWVLAELLVPVLTLTAYIMVYRVLQAPAQFTAFVILGGTMLAFWSNMVWFMSAQFYWEKEQGNLALFMMAPISRMSILLGMTLGAIFNTTIRALVIFLAGIYIFEVPLSFGDPLGALLIFSATLIPLYGLGMIFASLFMLFGREAWHLSHMLEEPMYFLGGFYFPVLGSRFFPVAVQLAASIIPVTLGLDALRKFVVLGTPMPELWFNIVGLLILTAAIFPLSKITLAFMENLAKREGRLTLRWQ
jgi:ABC-2 type transport system permease protein